MRATAVGWFFGIGRIGSFLAPTVVGLMLAGGLGHYVLHTFALTFLIASFAILAIGIETKGMVLVADHDRATGRTRHISAVACPGRFGPERWGTADLKRQKQAFRWPFTCVYSACAIIWRLKG